MPDRMEREINEIMGRLGEPAPGEPPHGRVRRLVDGWMAGLRRMASHRPSLSRRQVTLASAAVVLLVGAGLFFGLFLPSLTSGDSGGGEAAHESGGEHIGDVGAVDDTRLEDSAGEASGADGRESREEDDEVPDDYGRGDGDHDEDHH